MNRRDFLSTVPLALAATALTPSKVLAENDSAKSKPATEMSSQSVAAPAKSSAPSAHELDFATALQAAEAIRTKQISSVELTERMFARIDHYNPQLNVFAYQLREDALAQARKADAMLASGRSSSSKTPGVFHGVPITVKESFAVAGRPCTWGFTPLRDSKARQNSEVVSRLLNDAGAVLLGATNVPVALADWQSYNPIYGQTNNPLDVKRSPGGSSGGSAAGLAAGLGYLSVGSDIGGSIRVPAHFCGLFGHKPTLDLVNMQGHIPGGNPGLPGFSTLLAVGGPLARSAGDLLAAIKVLGGPAGWDAKAWKWQMPEPRANSLKDFRVGYVIDDPIAPPTPEVRVVLENVVERLGRAGAKMKPGWPAGLKPAELMANYKFMLEAFFYSTAPPEEQERERKTFANSLAAKNSGALSSFADWQQQNFRRLAYRAQWQAYFNQVDVFLSPVAFTSAFPHDHSEPQDQRTIATSAGRRHYMDLINWISPATLTGCPATVAPVGRTPGGLPVGIQIMAPFWEDASSITFADLLAREVGGFVPPPGYYQ
ncbi:MAG TPA: amidase family protein [Candidatus Angelobacter sp.]|nr:amidase family protein [Candidatus Angelobacter sp.]